MERTTTEPGFTSLFDGTPSSFKKWQQIGTDIVTLTDETIVTCCSTSSFGLLFYVEETFGDFLLRLEFSLFDPQTDNSGIFVRFRDPRLPPPENILARDKFGDISKNHAWIAVYSGFEIQIDEQARGNKRLGEPDGLDKHRTGAVYDIPTGQRGEPKMQTYTPPEPLKANHWNRCEIEVSGQTYVARINGETTTKFINMEPDRGIHPNADPASGYIGLQSYRDSRVSFRNIRIRKV